MVLLRGRSHDRPTLNFRYATCPIYWGDDAEGVMMYLRAKGVSPDDIAQALERVAQAGGYIIQQE